MEAATASNPEEAQATVWGPAVSGLGGRAKAVLGAHTGATASGDEELAAVYCLRERGAAASEPLAFVVLLAWSGDVAGGAPARRSEALIVAMAESVAANVPLYLLCAVPGEDPAEELLRECARLRVSLLLTGASYRSDVVTISRAGLRPGEGPSDVTVARCPSFKPGVSISGMTRARVNAWRGDVEVAFLPDLGSDRSRRPVQVAIQLLSASRVTGSERRLHSQVRSLIGKASEDVAGKPEQEAAVKTFRDEVESMWPAEAYATLGNDAGEVPLPVNRHETYNLLLLLRERAGGYDVLLSNHSPLRPSPLSDWNTMLLPAFKDVRALLEHLRDDVMRQVQERAEDFERAAHAQAFEQAVGRILADDGGHGDDLWADEIREVATRKIRKISPTTGAVTEFDYRFVTLLPLIDRATAKPADEDDFERGGATAALPPPDHRVAQRPRHGGSARRRAGRPSRPLARRAGSRRLRPAMGPQGRVEHRRGRGAAPPSAASGAGSDLVSA